jgi:hypothetical protein
MKNVGMDALENGTAGRRTPYREGAQGDKTVFCPVGDPPAVIPDICTLEACAPFSFSFNRERK